MDSFLFLEEYAHCGMIWLIYSLMYDSDYSCFHRPRLFLLYERTTAMAARPGARWYVYFCLLFPIITPLAKSVDMDANDADSRPSASFAGAGVVLASRIPSVAHGPRKVRPGAAGSAGPS